MNLKIGKMSDSNPWIKNEWRAESEPGKKERVPSSGVPTYYRNGTGTVLDISLLCPISNAVLKSDRDLAYVHKSRYLFKKKAHVGTVPTYR